MSVHYGYNYKRALIKKLCEQYEQEIKDIAKDRNKQALLDEATQLILDFFKDAKADLALLEQASNGNIQYIEASDAFIVKLRIDDDYIQFSRKPHLIEIERGEIEPKNGVTKTTLYAHIIPDDKRCILKKIGKVHDGSTFDENVINSYIRKTFDGILDRE